MNIIVITKLFNFKKINLQDKTTFMNQQLMKKLSWQHIFPVKNNFMTKKSCIRETVNFLTNGDRAGDMQTGALTYRNLKENVFELLDVAFNQVTAILMLQK